MKDYDDDIDGLTREEAVRLCIRRHEELSNEAAVWIAKLRRDKPLNKAESVRLAGYVRKLRQDSLLAPQEAP